MPQIGYRPPAGGAPDTATAPDGSILAFTPDDPSANGWLYQVGIRCRRATGVSPTVALGVYSATPGGTPATLVGQTNPFAVTSGADAEFVRDLQAAVVVIKDSPRSLAVLATGAALFVGMTQAANIPDAETTMFFWDDAATVLHTNFDLDRSSIEGHLGIWGLFETNVPPLAPATVTPGSTDENTPQQIGGATPTFAFIFRDDNEVLPNGLAGDSLKRGRVQVKRTTGALVWDSGAITADSGEIAARQMTIDYTGPALASGTTYVLTTSTSDHLDAWSPVSAPRYFTIGAGRVDVAAGTPTGKRDTQTPGPFVAVWRHSGALATNAVEVRIRDATSGAPVRTSATLSMAVANNNSISVTWAVSAFAALPWDDQRLAWSMRARDTAGNWSGWSDDVGFWTDDPPHVPALVVPANNAVVTTRPLLAATCTDTDDVATGLVVKCRIKNAAGTVLSTQTMVWNAANARYEYQTLATDLATFATYGWDAYAFDGAVYSGGTTVEASAANAADRLFTYASGPVVAITAPLDAATVTTNTVAITWTCPTQVTRKVEVIRAGAVIHTSTGTTGHSITLPSLLSTGEQLHEGDAFTIRVTATDSVGLTGVAEVDVTLDYPAIDPLQPSVFLIKGRGDVTPTIVRIKWPKSGYDVGVFRYYRLERRISADMLAANPTLPSAPVVFRRFEIGQNSYDDHEAISGVNYTYNLRQFVVMGADTLASSTRSVDIALLFEATIIHDVRDPYLHRVVFDARRERRITPVTDFAVVSPWNQEKPVQFESDVYYKEVDVELVLYAASVQAANYDLYLLERQVKLGGILCMRDGRGNKFYGRWASGPVVTDPPGGRIRTVRGTFRELAYDESAKD
jgi:hypothetical protein